MNTFSHLGFAKTVQDAVEKEISVNLDYRSVCSFIDETHYEYMECRPSYDLDVGYALRVCISICLSIISACMVEEMEIAA